MLRTLVMVSSILASVSYLFGAKTIEGLSALFVPPEREVSPSMILPSDYAFLNSTLPSSSKREFTDYEVMFVLDLDLDEVDSRRATYEETSNQQEVIEEPTRRVREREYVKPRGRWIRALVTVYTPWDPIDSNSGYQDGFTSTMVNTRSTNPNNIYGIAADPRAIPYGTAIYVPGYWEALQRNTRSRPTKMTVVDDTGGAMRQSYRRGIVHVDLRFRTRRGALNWIRKNAHLGEVDGRGQLWMSIFLYED